MIATFGPDFLLFLETRQHSLQYFNSAKGNNQKNFWICFSCMYHRHTLQNNISKVNQRLKSNATLWYVYFFYFWNKKFIMN